MYLFLVFFIFFSLSLFGRNFSDFDKYQGKISQKSAQEKICSYLQKDPSISAYFEITEDSLILYRSKQKEIEYILRWGKEGAQRPERRMDLSGARIAIDPGHFGGKFAKLEERFIDVPFYSEESPGAQFDEGTLSFLTAMYLKELLEKEGALVFITRESIGSGGHDKDFFEWLKDSPSHWCSKIPLSQLFRLYYNPLDLRARAAKINAFCPDLSVVIHFNSHHMGENRPSNSCLTENNYNLVFIPGAFCKNELSDAESRYEFLRLILSDDLENSSQLSQSILENFTKYLDVPIVSEKDETRYLERSCLKVNEGVYARNLVMTRLVHGPVCYGETLIQNNLFECAKLNKKDFAVQGVFCSQRVREVAEAYFYGIKQYLLAKKPQDKIESEGQ